MGRELYFQKRRGHAVRREVSAGCKDCHGDDVMWRGPTSQGTAARHSYAHGHRTWVEVQMRIEYGTDADSPAPTGGLYDLLNQEPKTPRKRGRKK